MTEHVEQASAAATAARSARPRRWLRRALVVVAALVLVVVADWYQQNREMDHLLGAVQQSENAMKRFERDLSRDAAPYAGQCTSAPSSQLSCQQVWQSLGPALSKTAGPDVVTIQTTGAEVRNVGILPWHRALRSARDAYAEHNAAWMHLVDRVASNPAAIYDKAQTANIDATFVTARRRFQEAAPPLALFHVRQRIGRIWAR